jgi:hypothetical protein
VQSLEKRIIKRKFELLEENGRIVGRVKKEQGCKILKENKNHRGSKRGDEN